MKEAERRNINERVIRQLAWDYSCDPDDILRRDNIFAVKKLNENRRKFNSDNYLIKVLSINGKLVFCCDESVIDEVKETFKETNGAWFGQYPNIYKLNEIAKKHDHYIADGHNFFLPGNPDYLDENTIREMVEKFDVRRHIEDEIEVFRNDQRFTNALSFRKEAPDMVCFTASLDGEIIGMSGVSADCDTMWQIGIDVTEKSRGRNIGPLLTILIRDE
nr:hypothetical protein [Lachnospiraceae bacterium]